MKTGTAKTVPAVLLGPALTYGYAHSYVYKPRSDEGVENRDCTLKY